MSGPTGRKALFQIQETAGDKALRSLTLAANPIFTHLLLVEFAFSPTGRSERTTAMQPQASQGGGGRLSGGLILGSTEPCLGAQRRTVGREDSLPAAPAPRGALLMFWTKVPGVSPGASEVP